MTKDGIILILTLSLIALTVIFVRTLKRIENLTSKELKASSEEGVEEGVQKLHEYDATACLRQVGVFRDGKFEDVKKTRLIFSDYSVRLPSTENCIYKCPKCGIKYHLHFEHGDVYKCVCGLFAQLHGNTLKIWE